MSLQDELSQNARDPKELAQEEQKRKDEAALKSAEQMAEVISNEIKRQMVELVKQGNYTREYNKGRVVCYYRIKGNRYLKLNITSHYNHKHVKTASWCQFLVKSELAAEFNHLQDLLDRWGKENNVQLSWVIRGGGVGETQFPNEGQTAIPPNRWDPFELSVKAVSYFPVDPNYPMDYLTDDEAKDKQRQSEERSAKRIASLREKLKKARNQAIVFGIMTGASVILLAAVIWMCFYTEQLQLGLLLLCCGILAVTGGMTYSCDKDYERIRAELDAELQAGQK